MGNEKTNLKEHFSISGQLWDLHIHTCECPKSSDEFSTLKVKDYVDKLVNILLKHKDLTMISFTDHNSINLNSYNEFNSRKTGIHLLPGIEVDLFLDEENKKKNIFKQLIFYFDDDCKDFSLDLLSQKINKELGGNIPTFSNFVEFLITDIQIPFLISPHFMKQGNRGIESSWNEETVNKNINKYIDQLFCFWETSSLTNIERAKQFLIDFDKENRVSIISFSDSHNFNTLKMFLDNPRQYFNALPSFNGLRMAGSDVRRITKNKEEVSQTKYGSIIGSVLFNEKRIYLSNKLNSIIGGRGTGKSILLDAIVNKLNPSTKTIDSDRKEFVKTFNMKVFDFGGNEITNGFQFDYFNQGYINSLFKSKTDFIASTYFVDEFSSLKKFNVAQIRTTILESLDIEDKDKEKPEDNLANIDKTIIKLSNENQTIKFKSGSKYNPIPFKDSIEFLDAINKPAILPKQIKDDKDILAEEFVFGKLIEKKICEKNEENICSCFFQNNLYEKYSNILSSKNQKRKNKKTTISLLKTTFEFETIGIVKRSLLVHSYLNICDKVFSTKDERKLEGYENNKFFFSRIVTVQKPIKYLYKTLSEAFDASKCKKAGFDKTKVKDFDKLLNAFIYNPEGFLLDSAKLDDVISSLTSLDKLSIEIEDTIFYEKGGVKKDVKVLSPGSKANILMEYIVFKNTSIPLFIDQPEDNIDKRTIASTLTKWFENLKTHRQVFVATHDANIVVNSDSENIIIANHDNEDDFSYMYGALEYKNNTEQVALILDGGAEALERRLEKYGERNEQVSE